MVVHTQSMNCTKIGDCGRVSPPSWSWPACEFSHGVSQGEAHHVRTELALNYTTSLVELVAEGEPLLLNKNAKSTYGPVEGIHHKLHLDRQK